ncbi:hypothetical protein RB195_020959 [Necator americanus]|uniref:Reverse transcriptase domain-containing protein n=1 Tax=Necator americanus TaxID=51031 RepID=A0ABR1CM84_NECAM
MTSATIAQSAQSVRHLQALYKSDNALRGLKKSWMKDRNARKQGFEKDTARLTTFTLFRKIEVSREYKMPLCLTYIDLKKAFDSVETEAVMKALNNQSVRTQYIKGTSRAVQ